MFEQFCRIAAQEGTILPQERITVALSGGADSVCLLYLCSQLRKTVPFFLSAAHVNHSLRPEADAEEAFCRELCRRWEIPLFCTRADVRAIAEQERIGIELAGRKERYRFFDSLQTDKIALAHHRDDQAETVLLHLLRGSGTEGLGAMAPIRGRYVRPLLSFSKEEILRFCREQQLEFCTDESNFSTEYSRNRIRLTVIPELKKLQPNLTEVLCRTAELLRDDEQALKAQEERLFSALFRENETGFSCERAAFADCSVSMQRRLLRRCCLLLCGTTADCSYEAVESARALIALGKTGKQCDLTPAVFAENCYNTVRVIPRSAPPEPFRLSLSAGEQKQIAPLGLTVRADLTDRPCGDAQWNFDASLLKTGLILRTRLPGDVFFFRGHHHKLKDLLIDRKIPRYQRDRLIIAEYDRQIIAVSSLGITERFRGQTNCLAVSWERTQQNENRRND